MNGTDIKERILAAVQIDQYIGRYVTLKKQGRTYKGLCPFHKEKTPSFIVTPDKGIYHCFGCNKGGDIFSFVMDYEGVPFVEALNILSTYAGIERVETGGDPRARERKELMALNLKVQNHFQEFLQSSGGAMALNYLLERGISRETIDHFKLGASPDEWSWLADKLSSQSQELSKLGLIKKGQKEGYYDFFRGRVIFPIHDEQGGVAGFGGRVLDSSAKTAKYINSPESEIFKKNRILYGLHQGIRQLRESKECILVEGYIDVIGLYQRGILNSVAPLGTAFGENHLKLLNRYVTQITFLLDGDSAGRQAALRSASLVVEHRTIAARIVLLPAQMDPFDLARRHSLAEVEQVLAQGFSSERYLLVESMLSDRFLGVVAENQAAENPVEYSRLAAEFYRSPGKYITLDLEEKRRAMNRLFELLMELKTRTDQELFLSEGARILAISESDLKRDWQQRSGNRNSPAEPGLRATPEREPTSRTASRNLHHSTSTQGTASDAKLSRCEKEIIVELISHQNLVGDYYDELSSLEFKDSRLEAIWRNLEARYLTGEGWSSDFLLKSDLPENVIAAVSDLVVKKAANSGSSGEDKTDNSGKIIEELLLNHSLVVLKNKLSQIDYNLGLVDALEREKLLQDKMEMIREKQELEKRRNAVQTQ